MYPISETNKGRKENLKREKWKKSTNSNTEYYKKLTQYNLLKKEGHFISIAGQEQLHPSFNVDQP